MFISHYLNEINKKKTQNPTCPWEFPSNDTCIYDSELVTSEWCVAQHTALRCCCLSGGKKKNQLPDFEELLRAVRCYFTASLYSKNDGLSLAEKLFSEIRPYYIESILKSAFQPSSSKHLWSCACTVCFIWIN